VRVSSKRIDGMTNELTGIRGHTVVADEPPEVGGNDKGPRPTELLAMSLASCVAVTMEMYARRKEMVLSELEVQVDYELDPRGGSSQFHLVLKLPHGLSEDQVERLRVIAGKCPVHRVLAGSIDISSRVQMLPP
jgi:putative redox protein